MSNKLPVPIFEGLEPRLLLTTLVGGDVFEYMDADENIIRVALEGDIIVELIAGDIDTSSYNADNAGTPDLLIGDVPGRFYSSEIGRTGVKILGGIGGEDGVEPIGPSSLTPVTDPNWPAFSIGVTWDGSDNINIDAIASRDPVIGLGQTFGFNYGTVADYLGADRTLLQLVQFQNAPNPGGGTSSGAATVVANLQQATLQEDVAANLSTTLGNVRDFAIDPTNGLGYAINLEGGVSRLYSVSLADGSTSLIGNIFNSSLGVSLSTVQAMGFDETGQLWILAQDSNASLNVSLVRVDKANGQFANADIHAVLFNGAEVPCTYTGMAFNPESGEIYAIARITDGETVKDYLHSMTTPVGAGTPVDNPTSWGEVKDSRIDCLTYAQDIDDNWILVGIDHASEDGAALVRISPAGGEDGPGKFFLSEAGMVGSFYGLGSYSSTGRPLLYAPSSTQLIRGSAVTMPIDGDSGATLITSIEGASFRPYTGDADDGLLYFTARYARGEADEASFLFNIDVTGANRSEIQNSMVAFSATTGTNVTSLAWDQVPGGAVLLGFDAEAGAEGDAGAILEISTTTGASSLVAYATLGGEAVTNVTAISLPGDDASGSFLEGDEALVAIAGTELIRIRNTGRSYVLGPLVDLDDDSDPVRGEDLQGMTWNATMLNPFTGELGVLLATDATSDELVFVDHRERFPDADVFSIYIAQASPDAYITISSMPDVPYTSPVEWIMCPFEGNSSPWTVGTLRVASAQSGSIISVAAEEKTGRVYIGARREDYSTSEHDWIPMLDGYLGRALGVRAANVDDLPSDVENDVSAGIIVAESLLSYLSPQPELIDRLLGQNLDNVQGIAVDMQGNIVVVDSDHVDETGNSSGDQVAIVDSTGQASQPQDIIDEATGSPGSNIQGLDFGDVNFDGIEELYAILDVLSLTPQQDTGSELADPPYPHDGGLGYDFFTDLGLTVEGITTTGGGMLLYAICLNPGGVGVQDDMYELWQINRRADDGHVISVSKVGDITDQYGNRIVDLNDIDMGTSGALYVAGWNSDVPIPNASVGGTGDTENILALQVDPNSENDFFALDFNGTSTHLMRATRDAVTGAITGFSDLGEIRTDGGALVLDLNSLASDGTNFYTIGMSAGQLIPDQEVGPGGGSGDLTAQFDNIRALAVTPDGKSFFIYEDGTALNMVEIVRDPVTGSVSEVNDLGAIQDVFGNNITELDSLGSNSLGQLFAVGFNADAPVPTVTVGGDLGGSFNVVAMTISSDGLVGYAIVDNMADTPENRGFYMYQINRDVTTGEVTSFTLVSNAPLRDAAGQKVVDVNDIDMDSNSLLYIAGFDGEVPTPTGTVGGDLGADFDIVGLAVTEGDATFALNFNGASFDIYSIERDLATGAVDVVGSIGQVQSAGSTILGLACLEGGDGVLYSAGQTLGSLLPTENIGNDLGAVYDVQGIAVDPTDPNLMYAVIHTGSALHLYQIDRDPASGEVSAFTDLGLISTDVGGAVGPETAVLGINALEAHPATGLLYAIGYSADQLIPTENLGVINPLVDYDVKGIATVASGDTTWMVHETAPVSVAGHDFIFALARIDRVPGGGPVISISADVNVADQWGNSLSGIAALENSGSDVYFLANNDTAPVPSATVGGTLGDKYNIRGATIAADGTPYFLHFNGTDFTLYQVNLNADGSIAGVTGIGNLINGGASINYIVALEADTTDPTKLYVIGSDQLGVGSQLALYEINAANGVAANEYLLADAALPRLLPLYGLAQDPTNANVFYTVSYADNGGTTESALMKIDISAGPANIDYAVAAGPGVPGDTWIRARVGATATTVTTITALDFNSNGDLICVDSSANRLIRIVEATTTHFTAAIGGADETVTNSWQASDDGSIDPLMRGFASDPTTGEFFSIQTSSGVATPDELYISTEQMWHVAPSTAADVDIDGDGTNDVLAATPVTLVTSDGLPVQDGVDALAYNSVDGLFYGVQSLSGVDTLVSISAAGEVTIIGAVEYDDGGVQATQITAGMDFSSTGELIAVDSSGGAGNHVLISINLTDPTASIKLTDATVSPIDDTLAGLSVDGVGRAYSIGDVGATDELWISESNSSLFTIDPTVGDDSEATWVGTMTDVGAGASLQTPVTDIFSAIAFDSTGTLYGVQRDASTNTDRLTIIDSDGADAGEFVRVDAAGVAGAIQVDGANATVSAMDFTSDDRLIAYNTVDDTQISINTTTPTLSENMTAAGTASGLHGMTIDQNGRVYSANDVINTQIWGSENGLSLYEISPVDGSVTASQPISIGGVPVASPSEVRAMALDSTGTVLYAILRVDTDGDGVLDADHLLAVNVADGTAADLGIIQVNYGAGAVDTSINSLEFTIFGDLVGVDVSQGVGAHEMVKLNLTTPASSTQLAPGETVDDDLSGLAADSQGRFFSIYNVAVGFDELWATPSQLLTYDPIAADTIATVTDLGAGVVQIVTTNEQALWVVGNYVQNNLGSGDAWTGEITNKVDNFTFDITLTTGTFADVLLADGIELVPGVAIASTNIVDGTGDLITASIQALSFDPADTLYVARDYDVVTYDPAQGQYLATIDTVTGTLSTIGVDVIQVSGNVATIVSMDFTSQGRLVGINTSGIKCLVDISLVNPSLQTTVRSDDIDDGLVGLASVYNSLDDLHGRFFSINTATSELWVSADQLFELTPEDDSGDSVDDDVVADGVVSLSQTGRAVTGGGFQALAVNSSNEMVVIRENGVDASILLGVNTGSGVLTERGDVQAGGIDRNIIAMDYSAAGALLGIDDIAAGRSMIVIDPANPAESTDLTGVDAALDDLVGLAGAADGMLSIWKDPLGVANDELWISTNEQELFTLDIVTGVATLVAALDDGTGNGIGDVFKTLAFDATGQLYGVQDRIADEALVAINKNTAVVTTIGAITSGGDDLNILAMDFTLAGELNAIDTSQSGGRRMVKIDLGTGVATAESAAGSVSDDLRGLTSTSDGRFFSVSGSGVGTTELWISANEIYSVGAGTATAQRVNVLTESGVGFTSSVQALAVTPDSASLSLTYSDGVDSILAHAALGTGVMTLAGNIRISGDSTVVVDMDYNVFGELIGIDDSLGAGQRRLISIDTTTPANSTEWSAPGMINDGLVGFTFDGLNYSYSIYLTSVPDELWVSGGQSATFGILDPSSGNFNGLGIVGAGVISQVLAMAFSLGEGSIPGQQGCYVVASNNMLYEIDPRDGSLISAGDLLVDATTGDVIVVVSMNFAPDGLYAQDLENGRLVDIDLRGLGTGMIYVGDRVATTVGSLRPTVGGIAYDFSEDRFLAVDNSTGSMLIGSEGSSIESSVMMTLKGYTDNPLSDQVIGLLDQQIGKILIAGAVTGRVHINGSIDKFYAGWLLTGNTNGMSESASPLDYPNVMDNFLVDGDIRDLIVKSSIGTIDDAGLDEPSYWTGFDMEVLGRIGQVWTSNTFMGALNVQNLEDIINMDSSILQSEIEYRTNETHPTPYQIEGVAFERGELYALDGTFFNDSFDTAQYLGSVRSTTPDGADEINIHGELFTQAGDDLDFYAVSLLAGQTITVTLVPDGWASYMIGVFDPDGRLIATDVSNVDPDSASFMPFQFTADRPGAYRFAVAWMGDENFDASEGIRTSGRCEYTITIADAGELALGAVVAARNTSEDRSGNNIYSPSGNTTQFTVERGDLGAIVAGDIFLSESGNDDIYVAEGNVRAVVAATLGHYEPGQLSDGISIFAPNGNAGLIRATNPDTAMYMKKGSGRGITIGGDMQLIDGAGWTHVELYADGGLGVLRAGNMATSTSASILSVNLDGIGNDGIIDLIDVTGDMGTIEAGGPQISTGSGGNVRYIRVGGTAYQDAMFGGGAIDYRQFEPGQAADPVTDDSGGIIRLVPEPTFYNTWTGEAVDPDTLEPVDEPYLSYRTYGIRGGGVVLMDVISTGGISIAASSNGLGGAVEIGRIQVDGLGRAVVLNEDGTLSMEDQLYTAYTLDLEVNILGNTNNPIDIFEIIGGNFTTITNSTGGEIVNVIANSIGSIKTIGDIGLAKNEATAAAVNPINVIAGGDAFPFVQQHIGIVSGNIGNLISRGAIGNVIANGTIGAVFANTRYDEISGFSNEVVDHTDGKFDGIAGPILAIGGSINYVNIGEGLAPSGTGTVSFAGLYAEGLIGKVVNQGLGSDIRGSIAGEAGIGQIVLTNGSIINANIVAGPIVGSTEFYGSSITEYQSIDTIKVAGTGGIIGSLFTAFDIGQITVAGFGILNSDFGFAAGSDSDTGNITVAGYGIQTVTITGGANLGNITALGRGARTSTLNYPYTVRYSETENYDPLFGQLISPLNDIHRFLGTSMAAPNSVEGLIDNVWASGRLNLGMVSGYQINNSVFDFANSIAGIQTYRLIAPDTLAINGLEVTTGNIGRFVPLGDVSGLDMNIAGTIRSVYINADLLGDSSITASGPNGNIVSIKIMGDMDGSINASGTINSIYVGGDMSGSIISDAIGGGSYALRSLQIGGSFTGSLDLNGNVGKIIIGDTLGSLIGPAGAALQINGNLGSLYVGTSKAVNGSRLLLDVNVLGNLGVLYVVGQIDGDIYVGGTMNRLLAYSDVVTTGTSLINGNVTVLEDIGSISILNGDFGDGVAELAVTAGGNISSFTITGGDLAANVSVTSSFGDIRQFTVSGGDLLGTVTAENGTIWTLRVLGSDLGASSEIIADTINYLYVQGTVLAGAAITVDKSLNTLYVGQDVLGDIQIGSSRTVKVLGNLQGNLALGYNYYGTTLYVGGNMGDPAAVVPGDMTVTFASDATITVRGNVLAGTTLSVGGDLKTLNVSGDLAGDVFVDGAAGTIMANTITDAVLTAGLDMTYLNVRGDVNNSLVQTGIRRGGDNDFAAVDVDGSGDGRMGKLMKLIISGTATNSIISAGGDINYASIAGGMVDTTVSSGLVLGGPAIAGVINDAGGFAARLSDAARRNAARSDADRTLLRGDFKTAVVGGAGMVDSQLAAGVDPGADGIFGTADDNVVSSITGGNSSFNYVAATMNAGSAVVSDNGVSRNVTTGGTVVPNVTYAIADIAPGLEPLVGTAVSGTPVTVNGVTVTIIGAGQVELHNAVGGADVDTLVISGTNARTRIEITGAGTTIGRIVTEDDAQFYSLTYDGTLEGGTAGSDLWLDSPTSLLTIGTLGDAVTGKVGGDVKQMNINMQGSGDLRIGGTVTRMNIVGSMGDPLLTALGIAPSTDISVITTDSTDPAYVSWVFDDVTGNLSQVDLQTGAVLAGPFAVSEGFTGAFLTLTGMAFDGAGILSGVANLYNQSPTTKIGSMSNTSLSLRGLAVNVNGKVVAVETSELVALNGNLGGEYDIQAITVTNAGQMYAINDNAGTLELYKIDRNAAGEVTGATLVGNIAAGADAITGIVALDVDHGLTGEPLIAIGTRPGVDLGGEQHLFLIDQTTGEATIQVSLDDGAAVTDTIEALCFVQDDMLSWNILTVRNVGGVHTLYALDEATGAMTEIVGATLGTGAIQVNGEAVTIIGMDIDDSGNVLAIGSAGGGDNQTFRINLADPAKSWALDDPGSVSADATGYASDANGAFYTVQDTVGTNDTVLRSWGGDRLVEINTTTGARKVIGTIKDVYNNTYYNDVMTLAFAGDTALSTKLYALISDRDGVGGAYTEDNGVSIVQIEFTDSNGDGIVWATNPNNTYQPGVFLDQNDVDTLTGAVDLGGGIVQFTTSAAHTDWAVGDALQNDTGNGNDWVGRIVNVVNDTTFDVQLNDGTFAVVTTADGIERNVTDVFNAMTVSETGDIYAIRRGSGDYVGQDHLVTIETAAGTVGDTPMVTLANRVQVGGLGDTEIVGMGFDASGNIVAYNHDTANAEAELIGLTAANLVTPNAAQLITNEGALDIAIDSFALGRSGANYLTYGFDTDNFQINLDGDLDYGQFFMNPGTVQTLGTIDTTTGVFTQWVGLAQNANGTTLSSPVVDMAFDDVAGNLFVVTADDRLAEYLPNGQLVFYPQAIGDTLSAGSVIDNGYGVVTITTDNPQATWRVGDYVGNDVGMYDDWFGQITSRINDTTFQVTLSKGAFADIDVADGILLGNLLPAVATITSSETGDVLDVTAIDFVAGEIIGTDARFNQLVTIDGFLSLMIGQQAAIAESRTENGAVDISNLAGLTYDPNVGAFFSFRKSDDTFVQFRGMTEADLGGIVAGSISNLSITGIPGQAYNGRIVTTGNTFGNVSIVGDFTGSLISGGDIRRFTHSGGDFSGRLLAEGDIGYAAISGGLLDGGSVEAGGSLSTFAVGGDFGGLINAQTATRITVGGDGLATADLLIYGYVSSLGLGGVFSGSMNIGSVGSLAINGQVTASADIDINGDVRSIRLLGGTEAGSSLITQGYVSSLGIGGQHAGLVGIRRGMGSASLVNVNAGLLAVGEKSSSLRISGNMIDSVVSFGTWLGEDGLYNTADDVITGGGVTSVVIYGNVLDSAIVAGVLPSVDTPSTGVNNLPTNMQAYIGDADAANYADINPAEHGGILGSSITKLIVIGRTVNPVGATKSVVAAANTIGRVVLSTPGQSILTREYIDPIGAPEVVSSQIVNDKRGQIVFSEEINTTSLILSQDNDGDGVITPGGSDVVGTVLVTDATGRILNDVVLSYSTQVLDSGRVQSVLTIYKADGFGDMMVTVDLSGLADLPAPVIYGSSLRSARMDLNCLPVATILASYSLPFPFGDVADDFYEALDAPAFDIQLNGSLIVGNSFNNDDDTDVYRFTANTFEYVSIEYTSSVFGELSMFYQDTQGTATLADDTFELVARYERPDAYSADGYSLFEAFELPGTGNYFILVNPLEQVSDGENIYTLELNRASTDLNLVSQLDGGVLPTDEEIAYVSNFKDQHNNHRDNVDYDPRQLVYLNFDGGTATKYDVGLIDVQPFNLGDIEEDLAGNESRIINGGDGVVGILQNILSIYSNISSGYRNELGNYETDTLVSAVDLGDGLVRFTTDNAHAEWIVGDTLQNSNMADPLVPRLNHWAGEIVAVAGNTFDVLLREGTFGAVDTAEGIEWTDHLTVALISTLDEWTSANQNQGGFYFTTVDPATWGLDPETDFTTAFAGNADDTVFGMSLLGIASEIDVAGQTKADNALIFTQNFTGLPVYGSEANRLNLYSIALANIISHELGHTFGLNHQPTDYSGWMLEQDDPSNTLGLDDPNLGSGLMTYSSNEALVASLFELGTASTAWSEVPMGSNDTQDLLLRWFS